VEILLNHYLAILNVSRPVALETETRKNGSRDSITVCIFCEERNLIKGASARVEVQPAQPCGYQSECDCRSVSTVGWWDT